MPTADSPALEVLTVGRISVDLYGEQLGAGWHDVRSFAKAVGGSPTNVAVAAARLGRRAAVLTKVGDDPFGRYVRDRLAELGVDTRLVGTHPTLRTPLAFAVTDPPEDPPVLFYRAPSAPDLALEAADVPAALVRDMPLVWVTGTGFSAEPSASTHDTLLRLRGRRRHTVLDLDYRPMLWASEAEARARINAAVEHATVAVGNRAECRVATGSDDPDTAADRLLGRGVELAVVKLGSDGVLVATADGRDTVPPVPVEVVCGLGAGDGFGGALTHGLLSGWDPVRIVEHANAAGAIVAGRLLCSDAMPTLAEIDAVLEGQHAPR